MPGLGLERGYAHTVIFSKRKCYFRVDPYCRPTGGGKGCPPLAHFNGDYALPLPQQFIIIIIIIIIKVVSFRLGQSAVISLVVAKTFLPFSEHD